MRGRGAVGCEGPEAGPIWDQEICAAGGQRGERGGWGEEQGLDLAKFGFLPTFFVFNIPHICDTIFLSPSDLSHFAEGPQGPFIWHKWEDVLLFSDVNNHTFLIHSSSDVTQVAPGLLLATVSDAVVSMGGRLSRWHPVTGCRVTHMKFSSGNV